MNETAKATRSSLKDNNPQHIANTVWAFVKVGHAPMALLIAVTVATQSRLNHFNSPDLAYTALQSGLKDYSSHHPANMDWAFAKAGRASPVLVDAITSAISCITDFNSQNLANTAWAYAKHAKVASGLQDFYSQQHEDTVWASVKTDHASSVLLMRSQSAEAGHASPAPFDAITNFICCSTHFISQNLADTTWAYASRLLNFDSQRHGNTVWAYVETDHASPVPFDAMADSRLRGYTAFNSHNLANIVWAVGLMNTVWAIATVCHTSAVLFDMNAEAAMDRLQYFNSQSLAYNSWACTSLGHASLGLFGCTRRMISILTSLRAQYGLLWAVATASHTSAVSFDMIPEATMDRSTHFSSQSLANRAWALTKVGHASPELVGCICRMISILNISRSQYGPFANTAWAFATISYASPELVGCSCRMISILNISRSQCGPLRAYFEAHFARLLDMSMPSLACHIALLRSTFSH